MSARTTTPLSGSELGMLATTRKLERELRQARRHEETAWAILAVDCDPTDFPKES